MAKVSRKIALQLAERSLARARAQNPDRVQAIAKLEANVAELKAMKGKWVVYA